MIAERIPWIDSMRGIAILIMIPANLAPYLADPHPVYFRFSSSLAAPLFIMISAGMVLLTASRHDLSYFLKRGALLVTAGAVVDIVVWGILPFTSFDVLYLIGLSLPLVYLLRNVDSRELLYLGLIAFGTAFVLQRLFGYHPEALEVYFNKFSLPSIGRLLQSCFVDGWFPVFPWIGFALMGALFFRRIFADKPYRISRRAFYLSWVLAHGGLALLLIPIPFVQNVASGYVMEIRGGYSEMFYPATLAYLISATGFSVLFSYTMHRIGIARIHEVLGFFGRYSMLIYILHQALGAWALQPILGSMGIEAIGNGPAFTAAAVGIIAVCAAACLVIDRIKHTYPPRSMPLKMLLGR